MAKAIALSKLEIFLLYACTGVCDICLRFNRKRQLLCNHLFNLSSLFLLELTLHLYFQTTNKQV